MLFMPVCLFKEVLAGLVLSYATIGIILPFSTAIDNILMSSLPGLIVFLLLGLICLLTYPSLDGQWTSAYSDTVAIVCSSSAIHVGSHLGYKVGILKLVKKCGFSSKLLSLTSLSLMLARLAVGVGLILLTRILMKALSYGIVGFYLGMKPGEVKRLKSCRVEFWTKFFCYFFMGFCIPFTAPLAFRVLSLNRF